MSNEKLQELDTLIDNKRPYQCPICFGTGYVSNGFYARVGTQTWHTNSLTPERCRSCGCSGIVWG